ncbi:putative hemoglobin and hemoglobin-haptoglobin-binding protein 3 [Bienertia sinuspersici]
MAGIFDSATLKIWHGGAFKNGRNGDLIYVGGKAKTFEIDPDVLCLHWLMNLAKSCGNYKVIEGFFYLISKDTTENGLRKVENDDTVREMIELMKNSRCLEVYVLHGLNVPALTPTSIPNTLSKETQATTSPLPQPSNTNNEILHNHDWMDPRPPSPIPLKDLLEVELSGESDSSDPNYIPGTEKGVGENPLFGEVYTDEESEDSEDLDELEFEEEDEEILDDELQYQSDSGGEEYILARQRVRDTIAKLVDDAKQIQKRAAKGQNIPDQGEAGEPSLVESDDRRKRRSGLLVSKFTDFASFKWKVGHKFAARGESKNAVAKYGILQGRDVHFTVSNKHMQQRPHWPASEIQECVRKAYKMLVSKDFAYKVKYAAHKKLHGSMHDHYNKLGGYMEALKASSPGVGVQGVVGDKGKLLQQEEGVEIRTMLVQVEVKGEGQQVVEE